jgi:phosphatidylserine/phosphatidylglycerophosphate/cardiolipin synthase-like enzyme
VAISVIAAADTDDVVVAWKTGGKIANCLGFAIERTATGQDPVFLKTEVGFAGDPTTPEGTTESSEKWPIQRFVWTDHLAPAGVDLIYTVHAVMGSAANPTLGIAGSSEPLKRDTNSSPGYSLFPNRGIAAAPWIERSIQAAMNAHAEPKPTPSALLESSIAQEGNAIREKLAGPVLIALRAQFAQAEAAGEDMYLALYELQDDELIKLLISAGKRVHLILGNGSFATTGTPAQIDPNGAAAVRLTTAGISVQRRMVQSGHYAHNKFIVFAHGGVPTRVWTGSTNWTPSGLCTQANQAVVVEDPTLAQKYLDYWSRLIAAGNDYPPSLAVADSTATTAGTPDTRAWFAPVNKYVDLEDARTLIGNAEQGALFLMFRPGNAHTLVDDIELLHKRGLFIRGVVNTGFLGSTNTGPAIDFFDSQAKITHGDPELILPAHLRTPVGPFDAETESTGVLIHSKVIVIDPFGNNPVIITGSHNLGQKASSSNDDNLLIIENQPGLAAEFAVYVMNVYDHYKWRYELGLKAETNSAAKSGAKQTATKTPTTTPAATTPPTTNPPTTTKNSPWDGLSKSADDWQSPSYLAAAAVQAKFWFGG